MTYQSPVFFERTAAERRDGIRSWNRPDINFFASGACHVLAYAFMQRNTDADFRIIYTRRRPPQSRGHHVYVSDAEWAFDYFGWTLQQEVHRETEKQMRSKIPGWQCDHLEVTTSIEEFCDANNHRRPDEFAFPPWDRAFAYIDQFPSHPPERHE